MPQDPNSRVRFPTGADVLQQCVSWKKPLKQLLRQAHEAHCGLRYTSNQHVVITSDAGHSTTISNSTHGLTPYRRDVGKVIAAQRQYEASQQGRPLPTQEHPVTPTSTTRPAFSPPPEPDLELPDDTPAPVIHCPACRASDPGFVQPSQAALDAHLDEAHVRCPDCQHWVRSAAGLPGHKAIKHSGSQPWKHRGNSRDPIPPDRPASPDSATAPVAPPEAPARTSKLPVGKSPRRVRGNKVQTVELPDEPLIYGVPSDPVFQIQQIRSILGDDPRITELEKDRDCWRLRAEEAEAKLALLGGLASQIKEAADL